ncbi:tyrosine-type recombinase/integrase [Pseudomonas sp. PNPG3]|uniref:tyrosine-type recombinase/integrase n=1 Tax=Pseudomonas sp. PNPG3 TaxID=2919497 RepID=UPI001FFDE057|nr:tyrosine-type recombinase/integrase [Pseudomonas sp. PNPG3]MCK2124712.1 site-specific integrase [Pseudomonas sp. PNPG3]
MPKKHFYEPKKLTTSGAPEVGRKNTKNTLSAQNFDALADHVMSSKSLRERALMELVSSGARSHGFIDLQRKHLTSMTNGLIIIKGNFTWALPLSSFVNDFASRNCSHPDDSLFPSPTNNAEPLSSQAFKEIFKTWLRSCNLDSNATPHSARQAIIRRISIDNSLPPEALHKWIGQAVHPKTAAIYKSDGLAKF